MTPKDVLKAPNLGSMILRSTEAFADRPAHMRSTKSGFVEVTYRKLADEIFDLARGLSTYGLAHGDRVVILGETGPDWALTDWACQTLGLTVVPIYPTLPPDQTQYIAKDCEAKLAICHGSKLAAKLGDFPIVMVKPEPGFASLPERAIDSTLDRAAWRAHADTFDEESLATFIYTSGTTGLPKGAMLPHRCFQSLNNGVTETLPITHEDIFLSFLPLSHVFERYAGHVLPMSVGACVAYAGSLASLSGDMQKVRPTIMLCVPRFLEATMSKIKEGVAKQKPLNQTLFNMCLNQGAARFRGEFAPMAGLLDKLVGSKIREKTGGRIRFFVSGGAALAPHVSDFYIALGLKVLQGYGLTETCAATALNHPDFLDPKTVGKPIKGVEVKIAADGEILIRGKAVMVGYYNLPEETAKAMDAEGWFHSGDIGEFDAQGRLKITDRKKDLLVLGNGKNIAPLAIENTLKASPMINEAVLFGDGLPACVALIIPELEAVKAALGDQNLTLENMAQSEAARKLIRSEIDKANQTLADFEKVKKHALVPTMFTIEGGELTPSMKVKRRVVKEKYAELLAPLLKND